MIEHVWRRCCQAIDAEKVIIATDDERIEAVARGFGARVEMTSSDCLTGTDRVAEVAERYPADWYVNVQGDEPLIDPSAIAKIMAEAKESSNHIFAINTMCRINDEAVFRSKAVPKVVVDRTNRLLYISRAAIPTDKDLGFRTAFRQLGLYAFRPEALSYFQGALEKTPLEGLEDIEILRLLESGLRVQMLEVAPGPAAIDTPSDLEEAERFLKLL